MTARRIGRCTMTASRDALHLSCPPPRAFAALWTAPVFLFIAVSTVAGFVKTGELFSPAAILPCIFLLVLFVFACLLLYRNLLVDERLVVTRNSPSATDATLILHCSDIRALDILGNPGMLSQEARLKSLGMGGQKLLLRTTQGTFAWGIGLDDAAARQIIASLEAYCGKPLLKTSGARLP